jgi:hypothetical protein
MILLVLSLLFLAAGAFCWRAAVRLAPEVVARQADAMVRERHAADLKLLADARFETARQLLETVRRDRDLTLAATRTRQGEDEALDALRGYQSVVLNGYLLLVEPGFPLETLLPGGRRATEVKN